MHVESDRALDAAAGARALMRAFLARTGVVPPSAAPARYLWTDAFAVCNLVGFWRADGDRSWLDLAGSLVLQVHEVLGSYRPDDPRGATPLGGRTLAEAREHPTAGGLRIGKPLPERRPDEPLDERLEWDRDGQYFHYLTRWMHTLDVLGRVAGGVAGRRHRRHARELARVAQDAFTRLALPGRMVWKASLDLDRALVDSMGQHDPLDGFVTYAALREGLPSAAGGGHDAADGPALDAELRSAARMCAGGVRPTSDPLGIGGLLVDAARVAQLGARGAMSGLLGPWQDLVAVLLHSARLGLEAWLRAGGQDAAPWERRLTFRELGVAIGLEALDRVDAAVRGRGAHAAADELGRLRASAPVGRRIVDHWRRRRTEHGAPDVLRDIDEVMLATALSPGGYLDLLPPAS